MKLLLIEDDKDFADTLYRQLTRHGFTVDICENGRDGLFYLKQQSYQLVLLDRMIPQLDGMQFLRLIREMGNHIPVIFITGLGDLPQKIEGLNCGADDYVVKPFAFEELLARINCVLRRPPMIKTDQPVQAGDLTYHPLTKELHCGSKSCTLTVKESALFALFLDHPDRVLTREYLYSEIWGDDSEVESGNLDNYIYFLRNRLHTIGSRAEIRTVRGVGYQFID